MKHRYYPAAIDAKHLDILHGTEPSTEAIYIDYNKLTEDHIDAIIEYLELKMMMRQKKDESLLDMFADYCRKDVEETEAMWNHFQGEQKKPQFEYGVPKIERVVFNDPAIIVFWQDGTKTVVKADGDAFDPEKGLAMAISKKALGNDRDYYIYFKRWLKKYEKESGGDLT